MNFLSAAQQQRDYLVLTRRNLHQVPEIGLRLPNTQELVLNELTDLPLAVTTGKDLDSVVAVLRGRHPERRDQAVVIRADMDGLPVEELADIPFAATNGAMHACGHDLHTAMALGAARLMANAVDDLRGDVIFMFQPGEEGYDGAQHMLDEGLLNAANVPLVGAYALHVFSGLIPSGQLLVRPGPVMSASDNLNVVVAGKGGHGSAPHNGQDPIAAMAEMITHLQTMVTRKFDVHDPVVITVTQVHAGHGPSIIPEQAEFSATVRSYSPSAQERLVRLCGQALHGIADAHGVTVEVNYETLYPATINDRAEAAAAREITEELFGRSALHASEAPLAASEDFSRVLQHVPGVFIPLGATPSDADPATAPFNHSPHAIFDEDVLPSGAALLARLAADALDRNADTTTATP